MPTERSYATPSQSSKLPAELMHTVLIASIADAMFTICSPSTDDTLAIANTRDLFNLAFICFSLREAWTKVIGQAFQIPLAERGKPDETFHLVRREISELREIAVLCNSPAAAIDQAAKVMSSIKKTRKPLNVANLYALYLGSRVLRINLVILPSQVLESVHDAAEQALLTAQHLCAVIEPHGMLDLLSTAVQRELCLVATSRSWTVANEVLEKIVRACQDHPILLTRSEPPKDSPVLDGLGKLICTFAGLLRQLPLIAKICTADFKYLQAVIEHCGIVALLTSAGELIVGKDDSIITTNATMMAETLKTFTAPLEPVKEIMPVESTSPAA